MKFPRRKDHQCIAIVQEKQVLVTEILNHRETTLMQKAIETKIQAHVITVSILYLIIYRKHVNSGSRPSFESYNHSS